MGCGASAGGRGGGHGHGGSKKKYKVSEPPPEPEEEKFKPHLTKENAYHRKHCNDDDLKMVNTIHEAYPFEDDERKNVDKIEKVWNPLGDGKRHDWGGVSVAKMQKKITCASCRCHVLDRYEETPFFFCMRCRREHQHCELCISCYNQGAFATGEREKIALVQRDNKKGQDSFKGGKMVGEIEVAAKENMFRASNTTGSLRAVSVKSNHGEEVRHHHTPAMRQSSPGMNHGVNRPHPTLPSGSWKGRLTEGGVGRAVNYQLHFSEMMEASGSGPNNASINGTLISKGKSGMAISWVESHDWGTIKVDSELEIKTGRIKGKFKASDGDGGTIDLGPP